MIKYNFLSTKDFEVNFNLFYLSKIDFILKYSENNKYLGIIDDNNYISNSILSTALEVGFYVENEWYVDLEYLEKQGIYQQNIQALCDKFHKTLIFS